MDQAQVQVRIVVNDAGGGVGGGGSNGGAGANPSRQPVGTVAANRQAAAFQPDEIRQLRSMIREYSESRRMPNSRLGSGDGAERRESLLGRVASVGSAVRSAAESPSLSSAANLLTTGGEAIGGNLGAAMGAAGRAAIAAEIAIQTAKTVKSAMTDVVPQIMAMVLQYVPFLSKSQREQILMSSRNLANQVGSIAADIEEFPRAMQSAADIFRAQARLGGDITPESARDIMWRTYRISARQRAMDEYIKRDIDMQTAATVARAMVDAVGQAMGR